MTPSTFSRPRVLLVGTGAFGRNHLRITSQSTHVDLAGIYDADPDRAAQAALTYDCPAFESLEQAAAHADAAIVATPTVTHSNIGCRLMEAGLDVLIEKPIAPDPASARALIDTAIRRGRILQVGHLERFNPAIIALESVITVPLFFEVHRLSEFSPRSLDVDVVLDLMIHDIDIILSLTGQVPSEIRAAGISILSSKVDIANVRLQFPSGIVANLTASRVSTERVRKLRLFQPHEYISLDYSRQDAVRFKVSPPMSIAFEPLPVAKDEPLRLELEDFFDAIVKRRPPRVTGQQALAALEAACAILVKIEEHGQLVAHALTQHNGAGDDVTGDDVARSEAAE